MGYKRIIRQLVETVTGTHIYRSLPHGVDPFSDIARLLPRTRISLVIDVGANVGQSAKEFLKNFPGSKIYCFEPIEETYRRLQKEMAHHRNVSTFQFALGARSGSATMVRQQTSELAFLRPQGEAENVYDETCSEAVALRTLDSFCQCQNIAHIDFLKIDTEGHDLEVLKGTESMLNRQEVDIIQVEASMNANNRRHVGFELLQQFLEPRGYHLFGIYEQMNEWVTHAPNLRRTNPIFVSDRVIRQNLTPAQ